MAKSVKALAKAAAVGMRGRSRESVRVANRSPSPKTFSTEAQNRAITMKGPPISWGRCSPRQGPFLLHEGLEVVLVDFLKQSLDPATGLDRVADRVVEGLGDVGADLLALGAGVEREPDAFGRVGTGKKACHSSGTAARASRGETVRWRGFERRGSVPGVPGWSAEFERSSRSPVLTQELYGSTGCRSQERARVRIGSAGAGGR